MSDSCGVSEEQLWSWLDRDAPELEQHLAGCALCRGRRRSGALIEQDMGLVVLLGSHLGGRPHLIQTRVGRHEHCLDARDLCNLVSDGGLGAGDLTR